MSSASFKENSCPPSGERIAALYVHVPFCSRKCRYCDFYSRPFEAGLGEQFVQGARNELGASMDKLSRPLTSVYFGGGTPTALGSELLDELLRSVRELLGPKTEFTVEANPETLDARTAQTLARAGVNRVSVGVQSFDAGELAVLGRSHDVRQVYSSVGELRAAGISDISLDLIYGIPTQTLDTWKHSLRCATQMPIDHLSCYALSFEPGTPLHRAWKNGEVSAVGEEAQRECYYTAIGVAEAAGLEHYEISNFARPQHRCEHNLTYWRNRPYLGIGPSAASYVEGRRSRNLPDLDGYLVGTLKGEGPPCESERLTGRARIAEELILNLRLIEGVDRKAFTERFALDCVSAFPQSIKRHQRLGSLVVTPERIRVDREALFVSDSVLADIISEAR